MTHTIRPQPGILEISPYVGGTSTAAGISNVVKLSSNENPLGPSEKAKAAFAQTAQSLHRYPDQSHARLRAALAEEHGLDADRIICGAGSDEVIAFLCQTYAGPGSEVIYTQHGFSMYRISALAAGATPVEVAERDRTVDVDAILSGVTDRTTLVFIANPGNPTGTMVDAGDLSRLAAALPDHVLLVLDGAYAEFVDGFDGGASLVHARDNVVMTRTFSKIYGLGALRVGWGYGPTHVIDALNRVRGPFNLSTTQLETAEAALRDNDWVDHCRAENTRLRAWLAEALAEKGVPSDTSLANFRLARFRDEGEANACYDHLRDQGVLVRKVAGYGLPNCLRITIGDHAACTRVAHLVGTFREGQG
ncbi:MAG: histidinol-phosphate transaminase [Rhodobacteraceae bacterium]|nr:histidinol-phosphate transaminase [Paracoccaceae bacterium]